MEPIVLHTANGGELLMDPEDLMTVEEINRGTMIVDDKYQLHAVDESPQQIKEMLANKIETVEGGTTE